MRRLLAVLVLAALGVACRGYADTAAPPAAEEATPEPAATASPQPSPDPEPEPTRPAPGTDPAAVGAHELGDIPVLMYHRLLPDGGGDYDLTPEAFRAELAYLCDEGYRPVRLIDVVRGEIDVPAGTTPVVLTFDDSTREQIAFTDGGQIAPDTAIGILLDVAAGCDGFEATASLYVNAHPFGGGWDSDDLVRWLYEHGFELGNHTAGHANLSALTADEVQRELAGGVEVVTVVAPDAEVATLSLPLGMWPTDRELAARGEHDGRTYEHEGILLVGAGPAPSPFHAAFDPLAIPRIRPGPWDGGDPTFTSAFWFDVFERYPERRYVSDGDPWTISFPAELADDLGAQFAERANPYE